MQFEISKNENLHSVTLMKTAVKDFPQDGTPCNAKTACQGFNKEGAIRNAKLIENKTISILTM